MSDTRRAISQKYLSCGGQFVPGDVEGRTQAAMSEYAAALLEPPLTTEERQSLYTLMSQWARNTDLQFEEVVKWINDRLRARAAQERQR